MDRRSFLSTVAAGAATMTAAGSVTAQAAGTPKADVGQRSAAWDRALEPGPLGVTAGMERYTGPWTKETAAHLLRRAGFQYSLADLQETLSAGMDASIEKLLTISSFPEPPGSWHDEEIPQSVSNQVQGRYYRNMEEMQRWWLHQMSSGANPLLEKMAFFWHGHFTSELLVVRWPQYLYLQNDMYRRHAYPHLGWQDGRDINEYVGSFGNFKELAKYSVYDPAMLVYLNGNVNNADNPNENYAREILELFALGEGRYSEFDIVTAARSFTGWTNQRRAPFFTFDERIHDFSRKELLWDFDQGSGSYLAGVVEPVNRGLPGGREEAQQMIDLIFRQTFAATAQGEDPMGDPRPQPEHAEYVEKNIAAIFLAEKLYRFFVYQFPEPAAVAELADIISDNNFDMTPTLRSLFSSAHFYDEQLRGALIKTPLDLMAGLVRQTGISLPASPSFEAGGFFDYLREMTGGPRFGQIDNLELELLSPPNVAGWTGYHSWLSTKTFPLRNRITSSFVNGAKYPNGDLPETSFDAVSFAKQFDGYNDIETLLDEMLQFFIAGDVHPDIRARVLDEILLGAPTYEWEEIIKNDNSARNRLVRGLETIMLLPEFQLT